MDPISAGISAGANLLGSVFNVVSQERTNEHNSSMLDKQNQFNRDMQKDQQQYNKEMWEAQNAYNTPKSQLDRYRQAGLNPNLLYGQPNPGNAAQAATSGQASSSNAIARRAPIVDPLSMSTIQLNQALAKKNEEEAKGKEIENQYKGDKEATEIRQMLQNINESSAREKYQLIQNTFTPEKIRSEIDNIISDTALKGAQEKLTSEQINYYEQLGQLVAYEMLTEQAEALNLHMSTRRMEELLGYEKKQIDSIIGKNQAEANYYKELAKYTYNQALNSNPNAQGSFAWWTNQNLGQQNIQYQQFIEEFQAKFPAMKKIYEKMGNDAKFLDNLFMRMYQNVIIPGLQTTADVANAGANVVNAGANVINSVNPSPKTIIYSKK